MAESHRCQGLEGDCGEWANLLPVGFRFHPTDEELLDYYLRAKKNGGAGSGPTNNGLIQEQNVYDFEPSQLPGLPYNLGDGKMYFFTFLKKKFQNGSKVNRDTPGGTWKITQRHAIVYGKDGKPLGTKTPLAYHEGKSNPKKTQWLMQQYLLHSQPSNQNDGESTMWALCVVYHYKLERENKNGNGTNDKPNQSSMPNIMVGSSPNFAMASSSAFVSPVSTPVPDSLQNPMSSQTMSSNEKLGDQAFCFNPQFPPSSNPATLEGQHGFNTPSFPTPFPVSHYLDQQSNPVDSGRHPPTQNIFKYLETNIYDEYSNFNIRQDFLYGDPYNQSWEHLDLFYQHYNGYPTEDIGNISSLGTSSDPSHSPRLCDNSHLNVQYY